MNQWSEAERFHQAALEVQPDHVATHVSYGTMLARNVSVNESIEYSFLPKTVRRHLTHSDQRQHKSHIQFHHYVQCCIYRAVEHLKLNCGLKEL